MRRWTLILCLALIAAFLISLTGCLPAPDPSDPTTEPTTPTNIPDSSGDPLDLTTNPTQPTEPPTEPTDPPTEPAPAVTGARQMRATVYWTSIRVYDGALMAPFATELDVSITRDADGQESISCDLGFGDSSSYDFHHLKNTFTLQHADPALPYDHIIGKIYQPFLDGFAPADLMIDFEKGYVLFQTRSIPAMGYHVASTDPSADPYDILEHFIRHQDPAKYPMPQRTDAHFCYDLSGSWMDEEGNLLEQMDFGLFGNLSPESGFNDDVDRDLLFLWPESFGYKNANPVSDGITLTVQEEGSNYHGVGLLRHIQSGELVTYWFNIFPAEEVVILQLEGKYLVSSTRKDQDAAAILSQFQHRLISHNAWAVNWDMTAYSLNHSGEIISSGTMRITGYIREYSEIYNQIVLDIKVPDGFPFNFGSIPEPYGYYAFHIDRDNPHDLAWNDVAFHIYSGTMSYPRTLINTEQEYYLGTFEGGTVRYLVACTDPNVPADQILAHFWDYLEHNGYTD